MAGWNNLSTQQKLALTLGVSAGAAALYICYNIYRDKTCSGPSVSEVKDSQLCVKVPSDAVKLLMGRDGAIRRRVRKQIDAHIHVSQIPDPTGNHEVTIGGTESQVHRALEVIDEILQAGPNLRVELEVRSRCMGRVIGQGGETINSISHSTGAKITCSPRTDHTKLSATRRITLIGTREQVEAAMVTTFQKVSEEQNVQHRAPKSSSFRTSRKEIIAVKKKDGEGPSMEKPMAAVGAGQGAPGAQMKGNGWHHDTDPGIEVPSPVRSLRGGETLDVWVSALENPEHFWIQILGSHCTKLDKLTSDMTEHYQDKQVRHRVEIQVGDMVAATFKCDKSWYRAKVLGFLESGNVDLYYVDYGEPAVNVDLYYVDYVDSCDTPRENVNPLRTDFLRLPFQAIKCGLAGISPPDRGWTEEALVYFENYLLCSMEALRAKICSVPSAQNSDCSRCYCLILNDDVTSFSMEPEMASFSSHLEDPQLLFDGSIELMRSDAVPEAESTAGCRLQATSTPAGYPRGGDEESLNESIAKITIGDSEESTASGTLSSASGNETTSPEQSSKYSIDSSTDSSSAFTSEDQSSTSSPLEDSSVYSPRGCFYYLTDELTSSSVFNSSTCETITVSSGSEEEEGVQRDLTCRRKATKGAGMRLYSGPSHWW
ncbi:hypothetical protein GDO86_019613 [Hymenochirus boettgeri]|uniref:Tudor domain-containing protein n=1 Tax=Hymenochirus boettgeri TaxID=247094 RepID=A0A8T2IDB4_9PIPI|nr:hypothetical protein GDO86_019613 [Hymenochirus boettgeri]